MQPYCMEISSGPHRIFFHLKCTSAQNTQDEILILFTVHGSFQFDYSDLLAHEKYNELQTGKIFLNSIEFPCQSTFRIIHFNLIYRSFMLCDFLEFEYFLKKVFSRSFVIWQNWLPKYGRENTPNELNEAHQRLPCVKSCRMVVA